ncbi:Gfo/Idh/MocA family protein [Janthinobacterium fluminis]|uniref:Gfo/Idh/MocA family oxidoreductase n=1 Tax=Janthinobacterium fluminis TaxID=2987524 RepID=A0ABT5K3A5_9BURK|nr:Gfo/Idh/MocA family oxidoreductase [Janthinobacterium fluminis]MDC8758878.1 Gfo/Idh/MocA family oxidoreductase [Janthinobacterium fluminis]
MTTSNSPYASGLRVAVIGLGRMGVRHLQAAQQLGMQVCGVADTAAPALQMAQDGYGVAPAACFTDAYAMLEAVRPQALVIATTAPSHAPFVLAAAAQGVRHILCEKPMATSLADAEAMIAACRDAGAGLAVNHQMRFMPQYTRVKALIGSAELGPLSSILVAGSNFGLAMNASHYFEMFRYIGDSQVHGVQAWLDAAPLANPRGAQFDDRSGRLLARSDNGVSMFIDFSATAGWGLQVVYICRHGQIVVDELNGAMRVAYRQAEFRDLPTTRYGMPVDIQEHSIEPADTVAPTMQVWNALLDGGSYPDGADGAHALACLVAAHASHEAGGSEVRLADAALPRARQFNWA